MIVVLYLFEVQMQPGKALIGLEQGFPTRGARKHFRGYEMAFSVFRVVLKIMSLSVPSALIVQRILCSFMECSIHGSLAFSFAF